MIGPDGAAGRSLPQMRSIGLRDTAFSTIPFGVSASVSRSISVTVSSHGSKPTTAPFASDVMSQSDSFSFGICLIWKTSVSTCAFACTV
jgi:hypothetical protein